MTRSRNGERVSLGLRDWIGLATLAASIIGSAWRFTTEVETKLNRLEDRFVIMNERIQKLEQIRRHQAALP